MTRKGRYRRRSSKAAARDRFPVGCLAERRREIREEYVSRSNCYKVEKQKLKNLKEKVNRTLKDVENLQAELADGDAVKNRKLLKRKRNPTMIMEGNSEESEVPASKRSFRRRKKETIDACNGIHGGSSENKGPSLDGIWLALVNDSTPARLGNYVSTSNKMMKKVIPNVCKKHIKDFENSFENQVRSLKVLYARGLLSKEQYKEVRLNLTTAPQSDEKKRTSLKFIPGVNFPKLLPYDKLVSFIKSLDVGDIRDIREDFCSDLDEDSKVSGVYRDLEEYVVELAKMYVHIDKVLGEESFLVHFNSTPYHFRVAVGADGAPFGKEDEATAWLVSFLNVGQHIASESENFLIAGANCPESHIAMIRYCRKLVSDIAHIEKQSYSLPDSNCVLKFTFELVPSDMKWAATFSGELPNSAHYFSSFGSVNNDDKDTMGGSLGTGENATWKPWHYQHRLDVADSVKSLKEELESTRYAKSTKRNKVLGHIRERNSRQEYEPILGQLVNKIFAEPLHNANNAWQQLHEAMLSHSTSKSNVPASCTNPSDLPQCPLAAHMAALKEMGLTRLRKKVDKWFEKGRNAPLTYRFTGKETKKFCHKFMFLINAISSDGDSPTDKLQLHAYAYVGLQLRDSVSRFSRILVNESILGELRVSCRNYFNACCLFMNNVTPTVWTIGYAVPYHAELLYDKFKLGLGINTMQGREAKHVRIAKYSKHATLGTRWRLVMRHDYIATVWLRKLEPFKSSYHKCNDLYVPRTVELPQYCYCGWEKPEQSPKCSFCSSELYSSIVASCVAGELNANISSLLGAHVFS